MEMPNCPKCNSEYTYEVNNIFTCPECFNEWTAEDIKEKEYKDASGNLLQEGDNVTVIKDLKINGSSTNVIKRGTKGKNIKLLEDPIDGHDIACKVDGFGFMHLKTSVVKKV